MTGIGAVFANHPYFTIGIVSATVVASIVMICCDESRNREMNLEEFLDSQPPGPALRRV